MLGSLAKKQNWLSLAVQRATYPQSLRCLLCFFVVFYFEVRQNCDIFYFRHKKSLTFSCKALIYLAPPDGLEPPT